MNYTRESIFAAATAKGFLIFSDESKNYNLNLIGLRTQTNRPNYFDDWMLVFWKYNGIWNQLQFKITTDPGLYWLGNVADGNSMGTAIVKEGQYRGMWKVGTHKGYRALQQIGAVTVVRDFDRDGQLDYHTGREESGIFGINCHRANAKRQSIQVDKWSAGCQVFADPSDFNVFLNICTEASGIWGNSFTYTLLNEKWL